MISEELNAVVVQLLGQLLRWQERKREEALAKRAQHSEGDPPPRAPGSKRLVAGLRHAS